MQHEVLDMEDVSDGASLSDFTLDDFIMELMGYLEANRKALEDAPNSNFKSKMKPRRRGLRRRRRTSSTFEEPKTSQRS